MNCGRPALCINQNFAARSTAPTHWLICGQVPRGVSSSTSGQERRLDGGLRTGVGGATAWAIRRSARRTTAATTWTEASSGTARRKACPFPKGCCAALLPGGLSSMNRLGIRRAEARLRAREAAAGAGAAERPRRFRQDLIWGPARAATWSRAGSSSVKSVRRASAARSRRRR